MRKLLKIEMALFTAIISYNIIPLHAEEASSLSVDSLFNLKVETASKRSEKISDAPASVLVVTQKQITERNYVNLNDLLMDLPSVSVSRYADEETRSTVAIRGNPGNNKFVILVDGFRYSPVTGEPFVIEDNYPLFNVKQVEIIYGPASALYGADAFSGIINLISNVGDTKVGVIYGSNNYNYQYGVVGTKLAEKFNLDLTFYRGASNNPDLSAAYPNNVQLGQQLYVPASSSVLGFPTGNTRSDTFALPTSTFGFSAVARIDDKLKLGFDQRNFNHRTATSGQPIYVTYGDYDYKDQQRVFFVKYSTELSKTVSSDSSIQYQNIELAPSSRFNNAYTGFFPAYKYFNNQDFRLMQQLSLELAEAHNVIVGVQYDVIHSMPKTADLPSQYDPTKPGELQGMTYPSGSPIAMNFFNLDYRTAG